MVETIPNSCNGQENQALRVGVLLDSMSPPLWIYTILVNIQAVDFAQLSLVILNENSSPAENGSWPRIKAQARDYWRRGFFNRYVAWDYNRYRREDDPFVPVDIRELVSDVRVLPVVPISKKFTDQFQESDLKVILNANLDVLLRFGFRILKGGILDAARYGVWSYHHGDNREYRGGPALFWEMYEQNPVSGTVLQILNEKLDGGKVIYRSFGHTEIDSLYANRKTAYWKTAEFMVRRLRDLHRYGWDYITSLEDYNEQVTYNKSIYRTPTNGQMVRFLTRRFFRGVRNQARRLLFDDRDHNWFIAYRRRNSDTESWRFLHPPANHFYADPFLLKKGDRTYLFFEDFLHDVKKGVISMVELTKEGNTSEPQVVLESDIHLSYPFVFQHEGEVYLMPETFDRRRVELYRAIRFPNEWALDRVLLDDVACVDATLHYQDGRWWLFANIAVAGASTWDELHVYYADALDGPWTPHPNNPVVSDVRSARPAGRLYFENGELIRPAQDCSVAYGYAVTLNRVEVLTESEYRETPIEKISPNWLRGNLGTHTLDKTEDFEVRDGKTRYRKLRIAKAPVKLRLQT